jgi:hypothetical protein
MRNSRNYLKTGKLICEFIDAFKQANDEAHPTWYEITDHLNVVGHPTKRGGSWGHSSAQYSLVRYCQAEKVDYPLPMNKGSLLFTERTDEISPDTNEITITLKITVPAGQKVNVVVD